MNDSIGTARPGRDARDLGRRRFDWQDDESPWLAEDAGGTVRTRWALAAAGSSEPSSGGGGTGGGGGTVPGLTFVSISTATQSHIEGASGVTNYSYVVSRSGETGGTTTVNWAVSGSGGNPTNASDFIGTVLPSGSLTFAPGVLTQVLTVPVRGDTAVELDEGFQVTLSGVSSTTPGGSLVIGSTAAGVILTDEASFSIRALGDGVWSEGSSILFGNTLVPFEIFRSGPVSGTDTVAYSIIGFAGSGYDAANADDFNSTPLGQITGTVTFTGTETAKTMYVAIDAEYEQEADEGFLVMLSNPTGGPSLIQPAALGRIVDDDSIRGTSGNDVLMGRTGGTVEVALYSSKDVFLIGGGGLDIIWGLDDTDKFWFLPSALGPAAGNTTTIEDFSRSAGEILDLSRIDAKSGGLNFGNDAFSFIGTQSFSGASGQLRWSAVGGYRVIQGDVNGDSLADLTIHVKGTDTMTSSWFVL